MSKVKKKKKKKKLKIRVGDMVRVDGYLDPMSFTGLDRWFTGIFLHTDLSPGLRPPYVHWFLRNKGKGPNGDGLDFILSYTDDPLHSTSTRVSIISSIKGALG